MKGCCFLLLLAILLLIESFNVEAQVCRPSGTLTGKKPPRGQCNTNNDSECCVEGRPYKTYRCSPPVTGSTKAVLTLNGFESGEEGGGPSACDGKYHSNNTPVVALSTGWFNNRRRCLDYIVIRANGKSVRAQVVDECDSTVGCDEEHAYQPPCANNIVDASAAVWRALGIPRSQWGMRDVTWSDA